MKFSSSSFRKWSRVIHRDLSFFFSGMVLIYAISGIVMNHRDSINPNFTVKQQEYVLSEPLPAKAQINKKTVLSLLEPLGEAGNYTKHYFPREEVMKVFLKGGSSLQVNIQTGAAVYESVKKRPILGGMTRLHYNPWTVVDTFLPISLQWLCCNNSSGMFMLKGKNGIIGRGGIELLAGILVPLLFLFCF